MSIENMYSEDSANAPATIWEALENWIILSTIWIFFLLIRLYFKDSLGWSTQITPRFLVGTLFFFYITAIISGGNFLYRQRGIVYASSFGIAGFITSIAFLYISSEYTPKEVKDTPFFSVPTWILIPAFLALSLVGKKYFSARDNSVKNERLAFLANASAEDNNKLWFAELERQLHSRYWFSKRQTKLFTYELKEHLSELSTAVGKPVYAEDEFETPAATARELAQANQAGLRRKYSSLCVYYTFIGIILLVASIGTILESQELSFWQTSAVIVFALLGIGSLIVAWETYKMRKNTYEL
ncbi:hypothetical protein KRX54_02425 [Actinomycetaceae bacterium TAE3-ERU4]|nr:hypothetical protein [Actinomycetaceae bacterium TAE3-ERU4]